eukprot:944741_1
MGTKQSKSSKLEDYVPTMTQNEYNMLKELEQSSNVSCKYDKQCKIFIAAKHYLSTKENMEHLYSFKHSRDKCKYAANCFAYNRVASSDSKSYAYEDLCHNMLYYHTNDDENKNEINTSKSVALSADEIENLLQLIPNTDCPDEEKCAIYNNVRDGKEINKDNYIHLKSLNHKRNICTDGEECKYWDAFKNKSKALEDICHCTIFYHPSSRSNIIYDKMESVNDFITHDNLGVLCCNGVCGSTLSKLLKSVCLTKWKNYHYKLVNNQSDKVNTDGILEWIRVHGFAGFVELYYPIMNDKEVIEFLHHVLSLILNTDQIGVCIKAWTHDIIERATCFENNEQCQHDLQQKLNSNREIREILSLLHFKPKNHNDEFGKGDEVIITNVPKDKSDIAIYSGYSGVIVNTMKNTHQIRVQYVQQQYPFDQQPIQTKQIDIEEQYLRKKIDYDFVDGLQYLLCVFILLSCTIHHRELLNKLCLNSNTNLIEECKSNGWDLENDPKYASLMNSLSTYMDCAKHRKMSKPLTKCELLSVLLYTGTSVLGELQSCHRKQNYCKWKILQHTLQSAIMKLHKFEKSNLPQYLYRGMHGVSMKSQQSSYVQPTGFMSTSIDKEVSLFFMSEDGCLMRFHEYNTAMFANIKWLSKYEDEEEYLFIPCTIYVQDITAHGTIQTANCIIYDINQWYLHAGLHGFDFICNFLGVKFNLHPNDGYSKEIEFEYSLPKYTLQNLNVNKPPKVLINQCETHTSLDYKSKDDNVTVKLLYRKVIGIWTYEVRSASSKKEAYEYLNSTPVGEWNYYIIVETPEGSFAKDMMAHIKGNIFAEPPYEHLPCRQQAMEEYFQWKQLGDAYQPIELKLAREHIFVRQDSDDDEKEWIDVLPNSKIKKRVLKQGSSKPKLHTNIRGYPVQPMDQVHGDYASLCIPIMPHYLKSHQIVRYEYDFSMILGQMDICEALDFALYSMKVGEESVFKVAAQHVNGKCIPYTYLPSTAYIHFKAYFSMCVPLETKDMDFANEVVDGHKSLMHNFKATMEARDVLKSHKYDSKYIELDKYCDTIQTWGGNNYASGLWQHKRELRDIGQEIYDKYGHDGMVYVCEKNRMLSRTVEYIWDGIGRWMV